MPIGAEEMNAYGHHALFCARSHVHCLASFASDGKENLCTLVQRRTLLTEVMWLFLSLPLGETCDCNVVGRRRSQRRSEVIHPGDEVALTW